MNRSWYMMLILGSMLLLSGCQGIGQSAAPPTSKIKNPKIILGSGLAGPYIHYPVAIEKKFFEKYGLTPEMQIFPSGPEAVQAVGSGAVQVSNTGEFTFLTLRSRGADLAVVGRNIVNTGDLGVGALQGINNPKDLIGKTCGALLGGATQWYAHRFVTVYGINPADIKLVNLAAPEWLPAMARGDIQCFFGFEPWLTQLPATVPGAHVIHRNAQDDVYTLLNPVGFNATWVREDPEAAKAAMLGMIDTMAWVNNNRREAAQIAAKAFQSDPAVLEQQMECCTYDMAFSQDLVAAFSDQARWGESQDLLKVPADELVSGIFNADVMAAVAPDRCTADLCKK